MHKGLEYELTGHKWFTSAPMCDGFLTLAQTDKGVTCFLVPRWLPNGDRNTGFQVRRIKDKLGDHANASSEVLLSSRIFYIFYPYFSLCFGRL